MRRGYMIQLQNVHPGLSDADVVRHELRLAERCEELGFDVVWAVEHHFTDYSLLPDNLQLLAYLAGRTRTLQLGSAGVILPWHQPLPVAERICMLDALCDGRFVFGMGRGLSRIEFDAFGIAMGEARGRFDESARMIVNALETGFIEGAGPFYPQPRTAIRPRPTRSFADRTYAVAMSPESSQAVAELGATMMYFNLFDNELHLPGVEAYRDHFATRHGRKAPTVLTTDVTFCDRDAGRAEHMARTYIGAYYKSVLAHYELMTNYHKTTKSYESHGVVADALIAAGVQTATDEFVRVQAWGTPQQILDKLAARRSVLGSFEWNAMMSYAALPFADVAASMDTLAKHVLPELASWA